MSILQLLTAKVARTRLPQWLSPAVGSTVSAHLCSLPAGEHGPRQAEDRQWIPHEAAPSSTVAGRRAAGTVEAAIESVLLTDGVIREHLILRYGLSIHRVRVANDRRTIYILWDATAGKAKECEQALQKNAFRIRRELAKVLQHKFTPYLEFRRNQLTPSKAAAATAMDQLEQELQATAAQSAPDQDVEAAIARLQQLTQNKLHPS